MTSEEFATKLLNWQKVAVYRTAFDCGEGYLRISYAYSLEDLKKALDRMEIFIQELREEKRVVSRVKYCIMNRKWQIQEISEEPNCDRNKASSDRTAWFPTG